MEFIDPMIPRWLFIQGSPILPGCYLRYSVLRRCGIAGVFFSLFCLTVCQTRISTSPKNRKREVYKRFKTIDLLWSSTYSSRCWVHRLLLVSVQLFNGKIFRINNYYHDIWKVSLEACDLI